MVSENRVVEVVGRNGLHGCVDTGKWPIEVGARESAGQAVQLRLDDGREVMVSRGALRRLDDGRYLLEDQDFAAEQAKAEGRPGERSEVVVPVVREELVVGTREVEHGGVRVRKVVKEREEVVNPPLRHEQVTIDRVAVQREVSGPLPVREEDGVLIVPLVEEVVVVRKAWVLREEIRINKRQFEVQRPRRVTLRSEEAVVERLEGEEGSRGAGEEGEAER